MKSENRRPSDRGKELNMSTLTLSSPVSGASRPEVRGRFALLGLATVAAAVLTNVLVYFAGDAVVGYDPDFVVLANLGGTISFTLVAAVVAVLLYAALLRFARNPVRVFTVVSAVVLVVSTIPDVTYIPGVEGASTGQAAVLVLMHVVAAAVIVGMLTKLARPRTR
jgi:hypothetical protein